MKIKKYQEGHWFEKKYDYEFPKIPEPEQKYNYSELRHRQAFKESSMNPKAVSETEDVGLYQINPITLKEYNNRNKTNYTLEDLKNTSINTMIRDWTINFLSKRPWITKGNPSDQVKLSKIYAAYNWGPDSLLKYLNAQKQKGVDIYNSVDWIKGMPKGPRNYVNYIVQHGEDPAYSNLLKNVPLLSPIVENYLE